LVVLPYRLGDATTDTSKKAREVPAPSKIRRGAPQQAALGVERPHHANL